MKYAAGLTTLFLLWLAEHLIYSGHLGWGFTAGVGAIVSVVVLIDALAESRARQKVGK